MARRQRLPWGRLLAEGVVIVAGVLIALAADRFVQSLDERSLEDAYLQRLLGEFEQARTDLRLVVEVAERRLEGAELVASALDGSLADSVTARQLVLGALLAHWLREPPLPREAWEDLIATGRMELIQSVALRESIAAFYRFADQQAGFHQEWLRFVLPYRQEIQAMVSPRLLLAVTRYNIEGDPLPDEAFPSRDDFVARLRANAEIEALLGEVLITNWAGARQYRTLEVEAAGITALLEAEIGGTR